MIGNLTLFTTDGEKIGTINAKTVDIEPNKEDNIIEKFNPFKKYSFSVNTKLDLFAYYQLLHGIKMTNNYLKMHGGIMIRRSR